MESEEDQSTSYADIAFGRSSNSPYQSISSDLNRSSLTLNRDTETAPNEQAVLPVASSLHPQEAPGRRIDSELRIPGQRRSLRDQRARLPASTSPKPFSLRHSSASPSNALRKKLGNQVSGDSPPPRPASALPAVSSIENTVHLSPRASAVEQGNSNSTIWSPDGKSPSYAEIFFRNPSITFPENNEETELLSIHSAPSADNTRSVRSDSDRSDSFSNRSQFNPVDLASKEGSQLRQSALTSPSLSPHCTSYSNTLASGLGETPQNQPASVKVNVTDTSHCSEPVQIKPPNPDSRATTLKSHLIQHPTIPGLVLKKEEACIFTPSSGSSRRRRKSRKRSGNRTLINETIETPLDALTTDETTTSPSCYPTLNRSKYNEENGALNFEKTSPVDVKPQDVADCVVPSSSDNIAEPISQVPSQTNTEPVSDSNLHELLDSMSTNPVVDFPVVLPSTPTPVKISVKKRQKKSKAKVSTEDEVEKALAEIDAEQKRMKSKKTSRSVRSTDSADLKSNSEEIGHRKTVKAKRSAAAGPPVPAESYSVTGESRAVDADDVQAQPSYVTHPTPLPTEIPVEVEEFPALDTETSLGELICIRDKEPVLESVDSLEPRLSIPDLSASTYHSTEPEYHEPEKPTPTTPDLSLELETTPPTCPVELEQSEENAEVKIRDVADIVSQFNDLMLTPIYDSAERSFHEWRKAGNSLLPTGTSIRSENSGSPPLLEIKAKSDVDNGHEVDSDGRGESGIPPSPSSSSHEPEAELNKASLEQKPVPGTNEPLSSLPSVGIPAETSSKPLHLKLDELSDAWMDVLDDSFTFSDEEEIEGDVIQNKQTTMALSQDQDQTQLNPPTPHSSHGHSSSLDAFITPSVLSPQGQPEFHLKTDKFSDDWMNILDDSCPIISDDEEESANDVLEKHETGESQLMEKEIQASQIQLPSNFTSESSSTLIAPGHADLCQQISSSTEVLMGRASKGNEEDVVSTRTLNIEDSCVNTKSLEPSALLEVETPQNVDKVSYLNTMVPMIDDNAHGELQSNTHLPQTQAPNINVNTAPHIHPSARITIIPDSFPAYPESFEILPPSYEESKAGQRFQEEQPSALCRDDRPHAQIASAVSSLVVDLGDGASKVNQPKPLVQAVAKVVQEIQKLGEHLPIPSGFVKDAVKCFEARRLPHSSDSTNTSEAAGTGRIEDWNGSTSRVLQCNEFVDSCQDQVLVQSDAERVWHEKLARDNKQSRVGKGKVGSGQDERKPPPDSDPFNRKGYPPGSRDDDDGLGGCGSGGGSGRSVSHILYSGLNQLGSEWLDISTKVPAHIYSYNYGSEILDEDLPGTKHVVGTRRLRPVGVARKFTIVPDLFAVLRDPCINFSHHYLRDFKHSTRADIQGLEEILKSASHQITTLNTEAVEETLRQTDELLYILKGIEESFNTLKEVISSFPQHDAEVKDLGHQTSDLAYQTRALLSCAGKLNKCAKDRILLIESEKFSKIHGIESEPENEVSNTIALASPDESKELTSIFSGAMEDSIEKPPGGGTISTKNITVESTNPDTGGEDGFITSLEVATIALPKVESHAVVQDELRGTFVQKIESSGFIRKTREVSMVQSFRDGVQVETDSTIRHSATHSEDEKQPGISEQLLHPYTVENPNSPGISSPRSGSPLPSASLSSGFSNSLMEQLLVSQGDDENDSMTVRVRQVTQHVTRRIIRKRRRIIRKVTVINGVETVTEEVIEEPDEVDEHTSEFTSGPVTDIAGRGRISPRHERRPLSPGVVISEIQDRLPTPEPFTDEGSNVPITLSRRPHSPQRKAGLPVRPTSPTNFPVQRSSKGVFLDVRQAISTEELPISVSECSMKISVKPIGESELPVDPDLKSASETQIPEELIHSAYSADNSGISSDILIEAGSGEISAAVRRIISPQNVDRLHVDEHATDVQTPPAPQILPDISSSLPSEKSAQSLVNAGSKKKKRRGKQKGVSFKENIEITGLSPSKITAVDEDMDELDKTSSPQEQAPSESPESLQVPEELTSMSRGSDVTDNTDVSASVRMEVNIPAGYRSPELDENPSRMQDQDLHVQPAVTKSVVSRIELQGTKLDKPDGESETSREKPSRSTEPSTEASLRSDIVATETDSTRSVDSDVGPLTRRRPKSPSKFVCAETTETCPQVPPRRKASKSPSPAQSCTTVHQASEQIPSPSAPIRRRQSKSKSPSPALPRSTHHASEQIPSAPIRRRQSKSPSPAQSGSIHQVLEQIPSAPLRRRQSKSPSPAQSHTTHQVLEQIPSAQIRRKQSKSPNRLVDVTMLAGSEDAPKAPPRQRQSKSPSPHSDKPVQELSGFHSHDPSLQQKKPEKVERKKKHNDRKNTNKELDNVPISNASSVVDNFHIELQTGSNAPIPKPDDTKSVPTAGATQDQSRKTVSKVAKPKPGGLTSVPFGGESEDQSRETISEIVKPKPEIPKSPLIGGATEVKSREASSEVAKHKPVGITSVLNDGAIQDQSTEFISDIAKSKTDDVASVPVDGSTIDQSMEAISEVAKPKPEGPTSRSIGGATQNPPREVISEVSKPKPESITSVPIGGATQDQSRETVSEVARPKPGGLTSVPIGEATEDQSRKTISEVAIHKPEAPESLPISGTAEDQSKEAICKVATPEPEGITSVPVCGANQDQSTEVVKDKSLDGTSVPILERTDGQSTEIISEISKPNLDDVGSAPISEVMEEESTPTLDNVESVPIDGAKRDQLKETIYEVVKPKADDGTYVPIDGTTQDQPTEVISEIAKPKPDDDISVSIGGTTQDESTEIIAQVAKPNPEGITPVRIRGVSQDQSKETISEVVKPMLGYPKSLPIGGATQDQSGETVSEVAKSQAENPTSLAIVGATEDQSREAISEVEKTKPEGITSVLIDGAIQDQSKETVLSGVAKPNSEDVTSVAIRGAPQDHSTEFISDIAKPKSDDDTAISILGVTHDQSAEFVAQVAKPNRDGLKSVAIGGATINQSKEGISKVAKPKPGDLTSLSIGDATGDQSMEAISEFAVPKPEDITSVRIGEAPEGHLGATISEAIIPKLEDPKSLPTGRETEDQSSEAISEVAKHKPEGLTSVPIGGTAKEKLTETLAEFAKSKPEDPVSLPIGGSPKDQSKGSIPAVAKHKSDDPKALAIGGATEDQSAEAISKDEKPKPKGMTPIPVAGATQDQSTETIADHAKEKSLAIGAATEDQSREAISKVAKPKPEDPESLPIGGATEDQSRGAISKVAKPKPEGLTSVPIGGTAKEKSTETLAEFAKSKSEDPVSLPIGGPKDQSKGSIPAVAKHKPDDPKALPIGGATEDQSAEAISKVEKPKTKGMTPIPVGGATQDESTETIADYAKEKSLAIGAATEDQSREAISKVAKPKPEDAESLPIGGVTEDQSSEATSEVAKPKPEDPESLRIGGATEDQSRRAISKVAKPKPKDPESLPIGGVTEDKSREAISKVAKTMPEGITSVPIEPEGPKSLPTGLASGNRSRISISEVARLKPESITSVPIGRAPKHQSSEAISEVAKPKPEDPVSLPIDGAPKDQSREAVLEAAKPKPEDPETLPIGAAAEDQSRDPISEVAKPKPEDPESFPISGAPKDHSSAAISEVAKPMPEYPESFPIGGATEDQSREAISEVAKPKPEDTESLRTGGGATEDQSREAISKVAQPKPEDPESLPIGGVTEDQSKEAISEVATPKPEDPKSLPIGGATENQSREAIFKVVEPMPEGFKSIPIGGVPKDQSRETISEVVKPKPEDPKSPPIGGATEDQSREATSEVAQPEPEDPESLRIDGATEAQSIEAISEVAKLKPDDPESLPIGGATENQSREAISKVAEPMPEGFKSIPIGGVPKDQSRETISEVVKPKPEDPKSLPIGGATEDQSREATSEVAQPEPEDPESLRIDGATEDQSIEAISEVAKLKPDDPESLPIGGATENQSREAISKVAEPMPEGFTSIPIAGVPKDQSRETISEVVKYKPEDPKSPPIGGATEDQSREATSEVAKPKPEDPESLRIGGATEDQSIEAISEVAKPKPDDRESLPIGGATEDQSMEAISEVAKPKPEDTESLRTGGGATQDQSREDISEVAKPKPEDPESLPIGGVTEDQSKEGISEVAKPKPEDPKSLPIGGATEDQSRETISKVAEPMPEGVTSIPIGGVPKDQSRETISEVVKPKPEDPKSLPIGGATEDQSREATSEVAQPEPEDPESLRIDGATEDQSIEAISEVAKLKPDDPESLPIGGATENQSREAISKVAEPMPEGFTSIPIAGVPKDQSRETISEVVKYKPEDPKSPPIGGATEDQSREATSEVAKPKPEDPESSRIGGATEDQSIEAISEVAKPKPDDRESLPIGGATEDQSMEAISEVAKPKPEDTESLRTGGGATQDQSREDISEVAKPKPEDPESLPIGGVTEDQSKEGISEVAKPKPEDPKSLPIGGATEDQSRETISKVAEPMPEGVTSIPIGGVPKDQSREPISEVVKPKPEDPESLPTGLATEVPSGVSISEVATLKPEDIRPVTIGGAPRDQSSEAISEATKLKPEDPESLPIGGATEDQSSEATSEVAIPKPGNPESLQIGGATEDKSKEAISKVANPVPEGITSVPIGGILKDQSREAISEVVKPKPEDPKSLPTGPATEDQLRVSISEVATPMSEGHRPVPIGGAPEDQSSEAISVVTRPKPQDPESLPIDGATEDQPREAISEVAKPNPEDPESLPIGAATEDQTREVISKVEKPKQEDPESLRIGGATEDQSKEAISKVAKPVPGGITSVPIGGIPKDQSKEAISQVVKPKPEDPKSLPSGHATEDQLRVSISEVATPQPEGLTPVPIGGAPEDQSSEAISEVTRPKPEDPESLPIDGATEDQSSEAISKVTKPKAENPESLPIGGGTEDQSREAISKVAEPMPEGVTSIPIGGVPKDQSRETISEVKYFKPDNLKSLAIGGTTKDQSREAISEVARPKPEGITVLPIVGGAQDQSTETISEFVNPKPDNISVVRIGESISMYDQSTEAISEQVQLKPDGTTSVPIVGDTQIEAITEAPQPDSIHDKSAPRGDATNWSEASLEPAKHKSEDIPSVPTIGSNQNQSIDTISEIPKHESGHGKSVPRGGATKSREAISEVAQPKSGDIKSVPVPPDGRTKSSEAIPEVVKPKSDDITELPTGGETQSGAFSKPKLDMLPSSTSSNIKVESMDTVDPGKDIYEVIPNQIDVISEQEDHPAGAMHTELQHKVLEPGEMPSLSQHIREVDNASRFEVETNIPAYRDHPQDVKVAPYNIESVSALQNQELPSSSTFYPGEGNINVSGSSEVQEKYSDNNISTSADMLEENTPDLDLPPGRKHKKPKSKKSKRKVTFKESVPDLQEVEREDNAPEVVTDEPGMFTSVRDSDGYDSEDPRLQACKKALSSKLRKRRSNVHRPSQATSIPGPSVSKTLGRLEEDIDNLNASITREDSITILEELTTIEELITVLIRSIEYEISTLHTFQLTHPDRSIKLMELEDQLMRTARAAQQIQDVSESAILEDDVRTMLDDIHKNNYLELARLTDKLTDKRCEDDLREKQFENIITGLNAENTGLRSLAQQVLVTVEDPSLSEEEQLSRLEQIDDQYQLFKQSCASKAAQGYQFALEHPDEELFQCLEELNALMVTTNNLITNERSRILQIINLSQEYQATLEEFSQVIKVAEGLLTMKPVAKNLKELMDQIQTHRRFFGNLKRCQQALEKLELELDGPTKETHSELHQKLYKQASDILNQASCKKQQLTVAASRFAKLQEGLREESQWLDALTDKIPTLETVTSSTAEHYCNMFQGLYSDIMIHQGRIMQLKSVRNDLAEVVECPELESQVDAVTEDLLLNGHNIASSLRSLVGFRDAYTSYDKLITRLRKWLLTAESKMDLISLQPLTHSLQFWELKAQLESQQPLRDEAIALLNQAMVLLPVKDDEDIWKNFQNFDDRWNNLLKSVSESELENYTDGDSGTNSVENILDEVEKEVQEIQATFQNTQVRVENQEDLYSYLETLQMLKAQILNQKYRVNTISPQDLDVSLCPEGAEKIGSVLRALSEMDTLVAEELETAYILREKFSTFGRMCLKTRRFQDTIRARVGQWTSFCELSQDILKQAFENCQSIDRDLSQNKMNVAKISHVLSGFPSTSHLSLCTVKLETELHDIEAVSHSLALQVKDLRHKVKMHLKFWQDYNSASNNMAQLISYHSTTLELLINEPPETLSALHLSQRYIQGLQNAAHDSKCINDLENIIRGRVESECPDGLKVQIGDACEALLADWKEVELQTRALHTSYTRGEELWNKISPLIKEIQEWTDTVYPQVELGKPNRRIKDKIKNLPTYEDKMDELKALATELCVTLVPTQSNKPSTHQFPISSEVEGLSTKLELLRAYWSSMQTDEASPDSLEEAKQELSSVSKDLRTDSEAGVLPSADRLNAVHHQLMTLGNAEGRLRAAQLSASTVPDPEFKELLESSQSLFQQTFVEYLKIWAILSEKEDLEDLCYLWKNYLDQVDAYLAEAIPVTRDQLLEDSSLCTVHQSILSGQHLSLASAMERKPSEFEGLQDRHTQIENQLSARQNQIQERLSSWKIFRNCQEGLSLWLRHMEREKRELDLTFLQLRRLESTKAKIETLVSRCPGGEDLIEEFKRNKTALMPFCNTTVKSSLAQDLSSNISRYNNLQAALRTWLDHLNRLASMNQDFQSKHNELGMHLTSIWEQFNELRVPTRFSELRNHIHKLKDLQQQASTFSPGLEKMQSTLEEMKAAISPADARVLSQNIWSLSQQHIDLVTALAQSLSNAEDKLDLIPTFDSRCKRWMVWADGMREKLERPHCHSLEEYQQLICRDATPEIQSKSATYKWLHATVNQLADMTTGREKKEFVKVAKEIKSKWDALNETVEKRSAKVNQLLQVTQQLSVRFQESMKKLKPLENYAASPISGIQEFTIDSINDEIRVHDMQQRKLNNESSEINHVLNMGEVAASDCDELRMYQDAASTRASLEALHNAWNGLIARFQLKYKLLNQLKDHWRRIADNCDYLETLLDQVDNDIEDLEKSDSSVPVLAESEIAKSKSLLESLMCLTPKVEDIVNDYSFVTKQMNTSSKGQLGERVKCLVSNWRSLTKRGQLIVENRRRTLQFANFCSVYKPAEGFLRTMNGKLEALSLDKSSSPEEKSRILKELKAEFQREKDLETTMKNIGEATCEAEATLSVPIKEQIEAYNKMKHKLEKLCSKVIHANQEQLGVQRQAPKEVKIKDENIPVEDIGIQVSTLGSEHPSEIVRESIKVEEASIPVSDASISEIEVDPPNLTRMDIYKTELEKAIRDSEENMRLLESCLSTGGGARKHTNESLVKALATTQKSVDMVVHLHDLLTKEHGASTEFAKGKQVKVLVKKLKEKEDQARDYGQTLRGSSPAKKVVCPVCSPKQRGVWDSTLWRLEQWLQHAEGTLKETMRKRPPTNLEQLEDSILNHRELLLDLDSHRSLVQALTKVLSHLNEHGATETIGELELERLKERLSRTMQWWNKVCHNAASWQARLQIALLENSDFHQTIEEYDGFISSIQDSIRDLEPVDISAPRDLTLTKLHTFKQLSEKLVRIEPELRTLLQTAEQLFVNAKAIEEGKLASHNLSEEASASIFTTPECSLVLERISALNHELGTSLRVTEAYVKHLTNVVQHEDLTGSSSLSFSLADQMLDLGRASPARSSTPLPSTSNDNEQSEETRRSALAAGGRYAYRAFRASLPIQALILLLLGAATLLPYSEQDFSCFSANNFARSLEPMLHWDGPPRI